MDYSLSHSGSACGSSTWTLTDPDDTVETYCQSGTEATLQSVKQRNGYTQTMHYTSSKLSSVTDTYGRSLGISYSSIGLLSGVTTPDTATLAYGYVAFSSGHLLSTVTYNTSPATHQTYSYGNTSFPTALTGITDENGHSYASWTYDSSGRGATSQFAGGVNFTSVTYFDNNGNRNVAGPLGIHETYQFVPLQGAPKVVEIDRASNGTVAAASEFLNYDSSGYLATAYDWNGNQTDYTNNSHGLPTQIIYASGSAVTHTTNITYDTTWARLAKTIATPGVTVTNTYDSSTGNLLTYKLTDTTSTSSPYSTNGQTRTWTMTYTSSGQLTSIKQPRTDLTVKQAFGYTGGALSFTSDSLGHTATVNTFTGGGLPLTMHDPNGVLTTRAYTPRNWLSSSVLTTSAGNLTTSFQYDSAGELTKSTLPDSSYLQYTYDNAHRVTKITNRLSETQNLTYNSAGNLTQTLWKNASATTTRQHSATFDALGRMLTDVGGVTGQTTTFAYDSNSNTSSITDPLSHVTTQTFDALNRLSTSTDAATDLTTITYDAHDRRLTVTDPRSKVTSYVYDGFADTIEVTSPDSGATVYRYNADGYLYGNSSGTLHAIVDAASVATDFTYDALDRALTRTYPADSSLNVAYTYDQSGHGYGIGRLTSLTDQAGSLSRSYDARGLLTSDARTISGTAYTTGYSYESAGRLASITYASSGWLIKYTRDNAGQLSTVKATQPGHSAVNIATSVTHYPFGPLRSLTWGNGITSFVTDDLDYRTSSIDDYNGATGVMRLAYTYDADSNVHILNDLVTSANNQTLTYDALDRLKSATGNYGTVSSITYDSNSNRLAYGSTSYTYSTSSNRLSHSGSLIYGYTSTGNANSISGVGTSMTYNKANQMASATVSSTASTYAYDAFGQRLQSTVGSNPTSLYSYDQAEKLLTESNSGVETDYVWLDSLPVAAIQPAAATISDIHPDRFGTPMKATDASKTVVWNATYDPNGKPTITTASVTQNLRLPGQYADATGFNYNMARYSITDYGLGAPRYLQTDPIGLAGAVISSGGGVNTFPYGGNNPYKNTDPSGLIFGIDDLAELSVIGAYAALEVYAPWVITGTTLAVEGTLGFYAEGGGGANAATAGAASTVAKGEMCTAALPPPVLGSIPAWGGPITAGAAPAEGVTAYRIWGGESQQVGSWLSPIIPESSAAARSLLALPEGNSAVFVSEVRIPAGTQFQYGPTASAFGQPGGGTQIQLLQRLPVSSYGPGVPLQ